MKSRTLCERRHDDTKFNKYENFELKEEPRSFCCLFETQLPYWNWTLVSFEGTF
jgi:hypothetical protein